VTAIEAKTLLSSGRRKLLAGVLALTAVATVVCLTRAEMWPCGSLDRTSGCVSSVRLDIEAAGIDPATVEPYLIAFDLSSGGKSALINVEGKIEDVWYSVLALYDVKSGRVLRVIDKHELESLAYDAYDADERVALSSDSSLAVMVRGKRWEYPITLYNTADGRIIRSSTIGGEDFLVSLFASGCVLDPFWITSLSYSELGSDREKLQFSADNSKIQCDDYVFEIKSGSIAPITKNDRDLFPKFPVTPDSDHASFSDNSSPRDLVESYTSFKDQFDRLYLAPDDVGHLHVSENRSPDEWSVSYFLPSIFRREAAVAVTDLAEPRRKFYSNQIYGMATWSRDAEYFGLISRDFELELYKR
jgi:hypothetical protein